MSWKYRNIWGFFLLVALSAAFCCPARAEESEAVLTPQYVGAHRCGVCHKGKERDYLYERWTISIHAIAYDILSEEDKLLPKCLGCHTTAFWERSKWLEGLTSENLRGVQCEACHGPGSLYRQPTVMNVELKAANLKLQSERKTAAGLRFPTLADCQEKCHNENCPNYKPLVLEKTLRETIHPTPRAIKLD